MYIMADRYPLPCYVGLRVYTHEQYGLASVSKNIFWVGEIGLH